MLLLLLYFLLTVQFVEQSLSFCYIILELTLSRIIYVKTNCPDLMNDSTHILLNKTSSNLSHNFSTFHKTLKYEG